jgi:NAD(P)H-dependent FMN reductase
MERPKVLVAYYSRTGNTKRLARAIAAALDADVEEIHDPTDRSGALGFLRSGIEAYAGVLAGVDHPRRDPADYDVLVVGTPVWAGSVSSPARTYLWHERARLPQVAFLATLGARGHERAFEQMKGLAGRAPLATLAVRDGALAHGLPRDEVARFAEAVLAGARRTAHRRRARASG